MIDSHCHLTDPRLHDQLAAVLARATAAGVDRMVTIGTDIEDAQAAIALCRKHENLRCAVGIHPNYVTAASLARVPFLRSMQTDPSVVALGEMGLDYHHKFSGRDDQTKVFEAQLDLAAELQRPIVIHCREAIDDCLAILKAHPFIPAVFHCFTGNCNEARRILDAGYLLGFTGVVTFKKSEELRKVIELTPLDRLLVETDAPYLAPEPFRSQKTNESSLVIYTARTVAELKRVSFDEVDAAATFNTLTFYGWK